VLRGRSAVHCEHIDRRTKGTARIGLEEKVGSADSRVSCIGAVQPTQVDSCAREACAVVNEVVGVA
jgi:hypothetical protein